MSGISSSVGLISGLPTADLIAGLMAIEARPVQLLQNRVADIQAERSAYANLSGLISAVQSAITDFNQSSFFNVFRATSSDPSVLTASAGSNATLGSFNFRVRSLVSNHQLISQGFADAGTSPVGAGTLTLEMGNGFLNPATDLEELNGGEGVRRGTIEITDRTGNTAEIDLSAALTVDDVLNAINAETAINVEASVSGDHIVLRDTDDTATGSLVVQDLLGGFAAVDLGIAQSAADGLIEGEDVINLADSTLLTTLNDANGIGRSVVGADFTIQRDDGAVFDISLSGNIDGTTRLEVLNNGNGVRLGTIRLTDRSGATADVDLTGATNLQEVVDAIQDQATNLDLDITYFNSSSKHALQITDNSTASDEEAVFKIEDVSGFAARDLGIATEADDGSIVGNGIHRITTVGDVMRAIQYAYDADAGDYNDGRILVGYSANGNGLSLSSVGIPRGFDVIAGEGSTAAADLGLLGRYEGGVPPTDASRDLIAGLNTVLLRSLNGGAGAALGTVRFTDRQGGTAEIDFSGAQSVQDVLDLINSNTAVQLSALVNPVGNGISIQDQTGLAVNDLRIEDVTGTMAADLGLAGDFADGTADSGNLQLQYISRNTLLADLNNGRGIRTGNFTITDSAGRVFNVNITENQKTLASVIQLINATGNTIEASVNATGDGLLITDTAGGGGTLKIEDNNGFAATDLNIAGEAAEGETTIDGSYEFHVEIDADDTLNDVVTKIKDAGGDFSASVLNDGSAVKPYSLVVNSEVSGVHGRIIFDGGGTGLSMDTLTEARDAVVLFGGQDGQNSLVLRSSTNTLDNVLEGITINLQATSDEEVNLSVTQDLDAIVADVGAFVDAYNAVIDRIDAVTSFDAETFERGILFADSTVSVIENRLFQSVTGSFENTSTSVSRLSAIGITSGDGGRLSFDEDKFREVYLADPDSVEQLFTADETGFGDSFDAVLEDITRDFDGLIASKDQSLESQEELLQDRIESLNELLDLKQARLEREFAALESALAILQGQQTSLTQLNSLATGGA